MTDDDDNPFPDESRVMVRFPAPGQTAADPRESWPWLPGVVEQRCGEDEWLVTVTAREVGELEDGSPAPPGTPEQDVWHPGCFRDSGEIMRVPGIRFPGRHAGAARPG